MTLWMRCAQAGQKAQSVGEIGREIWKTQRKPKRRRKI
jgi:hypothetical protein